MIDPQAVELQMAELEVQSRKLHRSYDAVTKLLRGHESRVSNLGPGVIAWTKDKKFGYGRDPKSKKWGFLFATGNGPAASIWEGSGMFKVELVERMEEVLEAILTELQPKLRRVKHALESSAIPIRKLLPASDGADVCDERHRRSKPDCNSEAQSQVDCGLARTTALELRRGA